MKRPVRLPEGTPDTKRIREVLRTRGATTMPSVEADLPNCDEARRFWSERAWSEFAAVPAMAQTTLAAMREDGALDELGALAQIAADEVRHTELSRDLADAFGGYVEDIPSGLHYQPHVLAQPTATGLPYWIVANGCISETLSLELMRGRLAHTRHPAVREVLTRIHQDEAVHARTAWLMAQRVLPTLSEDTRQELAEYVRELAEMVRRTFVTSGLPVAVREEARRIRRVTYEAGLGACPPDEADALVEAKLSGFIIPRLAALGLTTLER